jgi:hypothetical protein
MVPLNLKLSSAIASLAPIEVHRVLICGNTVAGLLSSFARHVSTIDISLLLNIQLQPAFEAQVKVKVKVQLSLCCF